jgi:UDP-N-acetylenolpyruvoylglucosamine reductase
MDWEPKIQEKFKLIIAKMPIFHRRIAEEAVSQKAEENAKSRNSHQVEEQDIVGAFFSDVPTPFYSMMIRLLEQCNLDYKKYGFPQVKPKLTERQ